MPVKKKVKAVSESEIDAVLQSLDADAENRHNKARAFFEAQDPETREAIERVASCLQRIARRQIAVGRGTARTVVSLTDDTIVGNAFYMAVECFKDLAQMDVKVANFTFPKLCMVCGKVVK